MAGVCDICQGARRVRLPTHTELGPVSAYDGSTLPATIDPFWKEFDCPQCVKVVPYSRVRALRVVTKTDYEQFGKYQNPIERGLAQQFGTYLMKEGLIKFGASNLGNLDDIFATQIQVSAEINIVTPANAKLAGAEVLVTDVDPPLLPKRLTREQSERLRGSPVTSGYGEPRDATPWAPREFKPQAVAQPKTKREAVKEAAALRAGIADRFSGIDFDGGDNE